jgi:polysaccharide pyruvyl transferase WcaK-like protein
MKPTIQVTADPVLALHQVDKGIGRAILRSHGLEGNAPLVGISVREWKDWSHYKSVIAETADRLVAEQGAKVVFLPMQWPGDIDAARKVLSRMRQPATLLTEEYTTSELLSLTGNLNLLIGIRLHALIFAALMHVPMAGISYDPKIDRFLETLAETPAGSLQNVNVDSLLTKILALWPEIEHPNRQREEKIARLRDKAFNNAELALALIEARKRG